MNKKIHLFAFLSLIIGLLFTSCVSTKKFHASKARVSNLQKDSAFTAQQLSGCNGNLNELISENGTLKSKNALLTDKNAAVLSDLQSLSIQSKTTIADQAKRLVNLVRRLDDVQAVFNELSVVRPKR